MATGDREPISTGAEPAEANAELTQPRILFQADVHHLRTRRLIDHPDGNEREITFTSRHAVHDFGVNVIFHDILQEGALLYQELKELAVQGKRVVVTISEAPEPQETPSLWEQYVRDVDRR
jgi:hypothetical protein